MKKILFSFFIVLFSWNALACMTDPVASTAREYKKHFKSADLVFFGKIASFDDLSDYEQTVTFIIHKTYKGPEFKNVTIINKYTSSCSAAFKNKGSNYYVFANLSKSDGNYIIENGASFIPQLVAEEYNIDLSKSHNN